MGVIRKDQKPMDDENNTELGITPPVVSIYVSLALTTQGSNKILNRCKLHTNRLYKSQLENASRIKSAVTNKGGTSPAKSGGKK